jgi:hypothetical protein
VGDIGPSRAPCLQQVWPDAGINGKVIEDTYDAMFQIAHSPALLTANIGSIFSIAFFNFFGVSVTKQVV